MQDPIQITSEIGKLQTVLLHRPGKEIENLTPDYLHKLLFDDIPYLPVMQKEHDYFANVLQENGCEVLYLEELMTDILQDENVCHKFLQQFLQESKFDKRSGQTLMEYLQSLSAEKIVKKVMEGVLKTDIEQGKKIHLHEMVQDHYPFYLDPMPNLYFTRDPAAAIGNGLSVNRMRERARRRESMFMEYIIQFHPRFAGKNIPIWLNRDSRFPLEGGDELILSKDTIAIGVSARTSARAIEQLAINLFNRQSEIKKVVAVEIPKSRAYMHLDTVFTMIDIDKFTIHSDIQTPKGEMSLYILEKTVEKDRVHITVRTDLEATLKEILGLDEILLIPCGGGDIIISAREQWNDGSNTLAIAPGVVVTYDRNYVSNEILRENGVKVIEVPSSELSRGRGGPRCMSLPLFRKRL
ncbi:arginine deiminase [Bacillaceae bacterium Marseille-Q3522]|nr:arginine deiminase [Bacillaceae bacterium Marseille-Q3522]